MNNLYISGVQPLLSRASTAARADSSIVHKFGRQGRRSLGDQSVPYIHIPPSHLKIRFEGEVGDQDMGGTPSKVNRGT